MPNLRRKKLSTPSNSNTTVNTVNTTITSDTSSLNSLVTEGGIMDNPPIITSNPTSTTSFETGSKNNSRYIKTSEALNLISVFDGYNISVHKFIRECKNAEKIIDPTDHTVFHHLVR